MSTLDYLQLARAAKAAAADCIAECRRYARTGHYTHRGVEVLAIDHLGERIGDPLDYLEVKEISGKRLAAIVKHHAPAQWDSICVQGGVDGYESFQDAMKYPEDYEPMVGEWEANSDDPEAAQVVDAERVVVKPYRNKGHKTRAGTTAGELYTRSVEPITLVDAVRANLNK